MHFYKMADRQTYQLPIKTVDGKEMVLVAAKTSRRTNRKGKTEYMYWLQGSKEIYYNNAKGAVWFVPMARKESNMKKYYDLYCVEPLTRGERQYLDLHPHIKLVK